jgi:hypothetical protein
VIHVLPDGPTSLGHPANEDLFAGTPVGAATSWRVCWFCGDDLLWAFRWSATMRWLRFFVVEVQLLLAGYRLAVFCCGMEGPLLDRCDDVFVDAVAKAAGHFYVCDLAG